MNLRTDAAQERRIEVGVDLPGVVPLAGERRLVPAHGERERPAEQRVVAEVEVAEGRGEAVAGAARRDPRRRAAGRSGKQQRLERPGRPERDERQPAVRVPDHARAAPLLRRVVRKQPVARRGVVVGLLRRLELRLDGQRVAGPDLAVRVRVAGAHRRARGSRRPAPSGSARRARWSGPPRRRSRAGSRARPCPPGSRRDAARSTRRGRSRGSPRPGTGRRRPARRTCPGGAPRSRW